MVEPVSDHFIGLASVIDGLAIVELEAIRALATVGEVSGELREVFGEWQAPNG